MNLDELHEAATPATALYRKKLLQPMRPYIPGEDLSRVSVNAEDTPEQGGMVAHNPDNPVDQWYVAKRFFEDNYEPADATLVPAEKYAALVEAVDNEYGMSPLMWADINALYGARPDIASRIDQWVIGIEAALKEVTP